jgi:hypothetical protein
LHDGHFAGLDQTVHACTGGMQSQLIADGQDLRTGSREGRAQAVVIVIGERDDGIEAVIAPDQLHQNQDTAA